LIVNSETDLAPPPITESMRRKIEVEIWLNYMEYRPPCLPRAAPSDRYCELFGVVRAR